MIRTIRRSAAPILVALAASTHPAAGQGPSAQYGSTQAGTSYPGSVCDCAYPQGYCPLPQGFCALPSGYCGAGATGLYASSQSGYAPAAPGPMPLPVTPFPAPRPFPVAPLGSPQGYFASPQAGYATGPMVAPGKAMSTMPGR